ncbi:alpha/beta hydrolase [Shewanella corallii]|uniref:Alpha/beta hydrolase n=1 Tax=Shewanella corallii TaxID=560080 RepID=A0ABT0NB74_9GAMM|nr:alpha/beta hydrolase [Shewanella corallii]MCL2915713.1 alpha/beta hydrolase [Shewanella corallii]
MKQITRWFRQCSLLLILAASFSSCLAADNPPLRQTITTQDGDQIALYLFPPSEPHNKALPAILTIHGGGWTVGEAAWTFDSAKKFADQGILAVAVEYRLTKGEITPIDAVQDICDSLKWVRNQSQWLVDPEKVATFGVSAGGHLAAMTATRGCGNKEGKYKNGGTDLLLLWSPALDMEHDNWFAGLLAGKAKVADYSPVYTLTSTIAPSMIIQGKQDTLTPTSGARKFCQKATDLKSHCELKLYPGVGHLLTRNLKVQERNFDPDPEFVKDGFSSLQDFLEHYGYTSAH